MRPALLDHSNMMEDARSYDERHQLKPSRPMVNHTYGRAAVSAALLHESVETRRRTEAKAPQPPQVSQLRWLMRAEETVEPEPEPDSPLAPGYKKASNSDEAAAAYAAALHKFKVKSVVEQVEARREQSKPAPPRKVHYASSGRGLVLARTAKAEFCLGAEDLALLDVTIVGGGTFDLRRERHYYDRDCLKALAERKHGRFGLVRKQREEPAQPSLTSPNAGKRKRPRPEQAPVPCEPAHEESRPVAKAQRTPARRSARLAHLLDIIPAVGAHALSEQETVLWPGDLSLC